MPLQKSPSTFSANASPLAKRKFSHVQSKVGSTEKLSHTPSGGEKKIFSQKLDFKSKAQSKIGSTENLKHKPSGGAKKIQTAKLDFKAKAKPKVGSTENLAHVAGGGKKEIFDEVKLLKKKSGAAK